MSHDLEVDGVVQQVSLQYHQRVHLLLVEVVTDQGEDSGAGQIHARITQVPVEGTQYALF